MLAGSMQVSRDTDRQTADLQHDAWLDAGVAPRQLCADQARGTWDDRPGLQQARMRASLAAVWRRGGRPQALSAALQAGASTAAVCRTCGGQRTPRSEALARARSHVPWRCVTAWLPAGRPLGTRATAGGSGHRPTRTPRHGRGAPAQPTASATPATAFFNTLPAVKRTTRRAGIAAVAPVFGLRPTRARLART
jgi:hypothetical protein